VTEMNTKKNLNVHCSLLIWLMIRHYHHCTVSQYFLLIINLTHQQVIMLKAREVIDQILYFIQRFRIWWECFCTCHMESVPPLTVTCLTQTCGSRFTMCLPVMPARFWVWVWTALCLFGEL
jgi:hypothetical protein